jgi:C1A family cysteine protease
VSRYGWIRQLPDFRDQPRLTARSDYPEHVDLRPLFPAVWDQGNLGSCTGHACAAALAYARTTEDLAPLMPSRLMLYYNARLLEGSQAWDSGAQIRDVIKGAAKYGTCPEELWPYDVARFATEPGSDAYRAATRDRAVGYRSVTPSQHDLCAALAEGSPVVFGFSVYESFESDAVARTGVMPMPGPGESLVGGHAVVAVGYDLSERKFIIRNSWGGGWGDHGYFYMPFEYMLSSSLASDFWTIELVTYDKP